MDRIALNENFDATSWGLEFEAAWRPSRAFRVDANLGYLKTRLKKGSQSVDVMNRTQGNPDWVLLQSLPAGPVELHCAARLCRADIASRRRTVRRQVERCSMPCAASRIAARHLRSHAAICGHLFVQIYGFAYDPFAPYNPANGWCICALSIQRIPMHGGTRSAALPMAGAVSMQTLAAMSLPNSPRDYIQYGGPIYSLLRRRRLGTHRSAAIITASRRASRVSTTHRIRPA